MNTLWVSQGLRRARRVLRKRTALHQPAFGALRFRRETVWIVAGSPACSTPRRNRRSVGARTASTGWGDLSGKTAQPAPVDTVALLRRVDPPRVPHRTRVSWSAVEELLGTALPSDYRRLIEDRGPGIVAEVVVHGPTGPGAPTDLVDWLDGIQRMIASLRSITCDHVPPPFYPEAGGILPWGLLYDGQIVGWAVTSESPDTWPVVVLNSELDSLTLHPVTATAYLLARIPGPEVQELMIG